MNSWYVKSILLLLLALPLCAQSDAGLPRGRALFRSNCAFCHGLTAEGGRGPNLVSAPLHHGESSSDIKNVIRKGVPGTTMPAFSELADEEADNLVLYLQSLAKGVEKRKPAPGNPQLGKAVYAANGCLGCHRIGSDGSVYGPNLSRIGASRSLAYLRESMVHPSADIPPEYEAVTVTTREGKRVTGIRVNEDTFTVQLRTSDQKFAGFSKDTLQNISYSKHSLMPAYEHLNVKDLENLLAYLAALSGETRGAVKEAEGVR